MTVKTSFAIKDALIFTGDEYLKDYTILVENGKISKLQPQSEPLPNDIQAISRPGNTVIPGLIDAHVHGLEGNVQCLEQSLRFGITTVCDMHNDDKSLDSLTELAQDLQGKSKYANFKCAGAGATIEGGWPAAVLKLEYKEKPKIVSALFPETH
jgi:imidazolonepropionase-like amidohydrolase